MKPDLGLGGWQKGEEEGENRLLWAPLHYRLA